MIKLVNRLRQPRRIIRLLTLLHRLISVSPLSPRLFGVAGLQHAFTGLRAQNSRRRIVAAKAFGIDDRVLVCTRNKLAMSIAKAKVRLLHIVCNLVDRRYARQNAARPNAQSSAQLVARSCTDRMTKETLCGNNRPILDAEHLCGPTENFRFSHAILRCACAMSLHKAATPEALVTDNGAHRCSCLCHSNVIADTGTGD